MMRVDVSPHSVVVWCTTCRVWSVLASSRRHAWSLAREHEVRAHPGSTQATSALLKKRDTPKP